MSAAQLGFGALLVVVVDVVVVVTTVAPVFTDVEVVVVVSLF